MSNFAALMALVHKVDQHEALNGHGVQLVIEPDRADHVIMYVAWLESREPEEGRNEFEPLVIALDEDHNEAVTMFAECDTNKLEDGCNELLAHLQLYKFA